MRAPQHHELVATHTPDDFCGAGIELPGYRRVEVCLGLAYFVHHRHDPCGPDGVEDRDAVRPAHIQLWASPVVGAGVVDDSGAGRRRHLNDVLVDALAHGGTASLQLNAWRLAEKLRPRQNLCGAVVGPELVHADV